MIFPTRASIFASFSCLSALVVFGNACNSSETDDTIIEPSRESRIDSLADAVCDRYEDTGAGCPGYGTGADQKYANETDCENDFRAKATNLWPADRCSGGRIDSTHFQACEDSAKNFACSSGGQNIVDAVVALDDCNANAVCTDPPN